MIEINAAITASFDFISALLKWNLLLLMESTYHYLGTHQLVFNPLLALKDDVCRGCHLYECHSH
jgi:hypothetical protein